jgi:cellulose synthase/poly-beta-1,6-N-acetylglucosamine synthase-like glycosyltransferase
MLFLCISIGAADYRVLVGSPIRQKTKILQEFLSSLDRLDKTSYTPDYYFVDDNIQDESSQLLQEFAENHKTFIVKAGKESADQAYICTETTHEWKDEIIWKVAGFKDRIIQYAKEKQYDYLFLIDSDIVLNPKTVDQLISTQKDVVSNVFWTCWLQESQFLPQVWMQDFYSFFEKKNNKPISPLEERKFYVDFIVKMRKPGIYEVGGLGACTLISKHALSKDISFKKIKNISFSGEDRHFCIRAVALGLDLHVDTHYPAYHIYRESALSDVENFKNSCIARQKCAPQAKQRITLSMIMKNEANRYLRPVLENAKRYITDAVIIDDGSTDNSVAVCEEVLKGIPLVIIRNPESKFHHEIDLRTQQWNETIKTNPDWMVFLDADEIFEDKFPELVHQMITNDSIDVFCFRLYDFWDDTHYREDGYWTAHNCHRPFLIRYRPDIPYRWDKKTAQHCGRMPSSIANLVPCISPLRLKHYGWAKKEDREEKYRRYQQLDPEAKFGIKAQYDSILDENPSLVTWAE